MTMRSRTGLFLFAVLTSSVAFADGVWDSAQPLSDALFYLDTRQGEMAMDRDLWKKIERDRKAAAADKKNPSDEDEDGDDDLDLFAGLADLNPEILINVTLVSRDPLRLMLEGKVCFHAGNDDAADKALDGLLSAFSDDDQKDDSQKGGGSSVRTVSFTTEEDDIPLSLSVRKAKDGAHEFLLLYNLKKKVDLPQPAPSAHRIRLVESFKASNPACCLVMNSIRWAPLLDGFSESRDLRRLMRKADAIGISALARGRSVHMTFAAAFRNSESAAEYAIKAESMAKDVSKIAAGPFLRNVKAASQGLSVSLTAEVDLESSWTSLMTLQPAGDDSGESDAGQMSPPQNRSR